MNLSEVGALNGSSAGTLHCTSIRQAVEAVEAIETVWWRWMGGSSLPVGICLIVLILKIAHCARDIKSVEEVVPHKDTRETR